MNHGLLNKVSALTKVAYVTHVTGHVNSKGEAAPWVIKQHNTGKILESFKSEAEAKAGLKNMESHKGSLSLQAQFLTISEVRQAGISGLEADLKIAAEIEDKTAVGDDITLPYSTFQGLALAATDALKTWRTRSSKQAAISNRGWFEITHNANDFQCPHCGVGLTDEEWNTEYGDKLSGDYEVVCPDCGKPFIVDIMVETRYHSRLKRPKTGSIKKAFGYYNFEWQGNDALLISPDQEKTILLSGKPAREFQTELEHIEEVTPNSEALEQAVNEYIASFFKDWQDPTEENLP